MGELLARAQDQEVVRVVDIDLTLAETGKLMGANFHDELKLYL